MLNQTSLIPPTDAFLKTRAPRSKGIRRIRTSGVMYVKYLMRKLESWTFLKNLAKLVVGFSGGL